MVPPQPFEFVCKIQRRQNCHADRVNGAAVGADIAYLLIDGRRQSTGPFIAAIAHYGQRLTHDFDVDTLHGRLSLRLARSAEFESVEAREDLLDAGFNLVALVLMLLTLGIGAGLDFVKTLFTFSQPSRQLLVFLL